MKLKILVKIVEKLLGMETKGEKPRADMFMSERLLAMALVFLAAGTAGIIVTIVQFAVWAIVVAVVGTVMGIFALLCWRNQTIHVISDEEFTYTTMFGNTKTYAFSDIQGLRRNQDSMTLFVKNEKVHIESMAVMTKRLVDLINQALKNLA